MKYLATLFVLFFTLTFLQSNYAQTTEQKLYRIYVEDFSKIKNLEKTGVNIYNLSPNHFIEIIATPSQAEKLKSDGFEIEYLSNDFKDLMEFSRLKASPEYHDYQETIDQLNEYSTSFPEITELSKIGESVLGRDIMCLKISDNAGQDEDEIPILICGNHHGNEVLGVEAVLYQMDYLLDNYGTNDEVTFWVDNYEIWFVPMVNPDGREAVRRYNDNDVDLNRNYSFAHTPGGSHGDAGFSEPETRAIRDLAAQYPPALSLTYHTSGRYFLYSWTHTDEGAPDSTAMINLGNILAESVVFPEGNSTGHYTLLQGGRWYFTEGEYCDYMYAIHNTLAFTVEMWTRQNPDGSVIPEVVQRNLDGFITLMRQASMSGVTGKVTDKTTGQAIQAEISIPAIDNQGKVSPLLADPVFGRFYKYLAPGSYQFLISAEGYRDQIIELEIDPENLISLDIQMEAGPLIEMGEASVLDGNEGNLSGNGNGKINIGENLGLLVNFNNVNSIDANSAYTLITSMSQYITLLTDSLYVGDITGNNSKLAVDTLFFTVDPTCPDEEKLEIVFTVYDSDGPGWKLKLEEEMYAPKLKIQGVTVLDPEGNQDGIWNSGEKIQAVLEIENIGRQDITNLSGAVSTLRQEFAILSSLSAPEAISEGDTETFSIELQMAENIEEIIVGNFNIKVESGEGYVFDGSFQMTNVDGYYEDFENGENGWTHASYGNTSNTHDDWMLGLPEGEAGDPDHAYSGVNCWGTDHGWELYMGDTWNGEYQSNVHNYLASPIYDCSAMQGVGFQYMRWFTSILNDVGIIRVNDSVIWESSRRGLSDREWTKHEFDISGIADGNPQVQIFFEMKSNNYNNAGGWNIDDFIIANGVYSSSSTHEISFTDLNSISSYPNPFVISTTIDFVLQQDEEVQLRIQDQQGRLVKEMINTKLKAGKHSFTWNGQDNSGNNVSAGNYSCILITKDGLKTKTLTRIN